VEPVALAVGQSRSVTVVAREKWNPTGVLVGPGQRYAFAALGRWNDGGIKCGPGGFTVDEAHGIAHVIVKAGAPFLRLNNGRYFCVVGSVGRDRSSFFPIGNGIPEWSTNRRSGHLECFANDVPIAYWNNKESVKLVVTRLP
jgi:hypothetical protein